MTTTKRPPGRPPKYPWSFWFDLLDAQGSLRLERGGADRLCFDIPGDDMRRRFLAEARRRGVRVTSTLQKDGRFLRVQLAERRTYPWDEWLAGQMQELKPGVDFTVDEEIMREQARRAAKQRGLGFRSRLFRGSLWIQALPREATSAPPSPVGSTA